MCVKRYRYLGVKKLHTQPCGILQALHILLVGCSYILKSVSTSTNLALVGWSCLTFDRKLQFESQCVHLQISFSLKLLFWTSLWAPKLLGGL